MPHPFPLEQLPATGFIAELPTAHRSFLTGFGRFLRPRQGEVFIEAGSAQDSLGLVLSGVLHVVGTTGDRQMLLASIGEGDCIGEINLFDPGTASATVIARADCLVWSVTRAELDGIIAADPEVGVGVMKGLLRQLSRRVRGMNEKLAESEQKAAFHDLWSPRES